MERLAPTELTLATITPGEEKMPDPTRVGVELEVVVHVLKLVTNPGVRLLRPCLRCISSRRVIVERCNTFENAHIFRHLLSSALDGL
jgi:hypothetical protein